MRHLLTAFFLIVWSAAAAGQSLPDPDRDPDLLQAWPAWLVGDRVNARIHFLAAAQRGLPHAQYNLAMMLIHGEGGPAFPEEACALLRTSAVHLEIARTSLEQYEQTLCRRKVGNADSR